MVERAIGEDQSVEGCLWLSREGYTSEAIAEGGDGVAEAVRETANNAGYCLAEWRVRYKSCERGYEQEESPNGFAEADEWEG
jgi:hypothetical protein